MNGGRAKKKEERYKKLEDVENRPPRKKKRGFGSGEERKQGKGSKNKSKGLTKRERSLEVVVPNKGE